MSSQTRADSGSQKDIQIAEHNVTTTEEMQRCGDRECGAGVGSVAGSSGPGAGGVVGTGKVGGDGVVRLGRVLLAVVVWKLGHGCHLVAGGGSSGCPRNSSHCPLLATWLCSNFSDWRPQVLPS